MRYYRYYVEVQYNGSHWWTKVHGPFSVYTARYSNYVNDQGWAFLHATSEFPAAVFDSTEDAAKWAREIIAANGGYYIKSAFIAKIGKERTGIGGRWRVVSDEGIVEVESDGATSDPTGALTLTKTEETPTMAKNQIFQSTVVLKGEKATDDSKVLKQPVTRVAASAQNARDEALVEAAVEFAKEIGGDFSRLQILVTQVGSII